MTTHYGVLTAGDPQAPCYDYGAATGVVCSCRTPGCAEFSTGEESHGIWLRPNSDVTTRTLHRRARILDRAHARFACRANKVVPENILGGESGPRIHLGGGATGAPTVGSGRRCEGWRTAASKSVSSSTKSCAVAARRYLRRPRSAGGTDSSRTGSSSRGQYSAQSGPAPSRGYSLAFSTSSSASLAAGGSFMRSTSGSGRRSPSLAGSSGWRPRTPDCR